MTNQEIKTEIDGLYATIKTAQDRIKSIREECKHESSIIVDYSWRPGCCEKRSICEFCGEITDDKYRIHKNDVHKK